MGVWFAQDENEIIELNFTERLKSMHKIINIWTSGNLSLRGRIMIIKALILPQIQFLFSMLYTPDQILKKIDDMLFKYLWSNKPPKIKRNTIIAPTQSGGLGMVDVHKVHTAAKCSWIKCLLNESEGKWKGLMWTRLNLDQNQINKNFSKKFITAKTSFHQQVLNSWVHIHNIHPNNISEILNQYLAYNPYIQIDNNHLDSKHNSLKMLSNL